MNEQLINLLIQSGMSPLEATMKAREAEQNPTLLDELMNMQTLPEATSYKEGGRVHLQEGGETDDGEDDDAETAINYQDIVDKIMASYPEGTDMDIERREPQIEALIQAFGPQLASALGTPLKPTEGGTNVSGQKYGAYAPTSAGQNQLQQSAINAALKQAGFGPGTFDNTPGGKGAFTGISGLSATNPYGTDGTGIAGYQQFLSQAAKDASGASAAALAGQNAGQAGINQAQTMAGLMGGQALAGQNAGAQQLLNAQQQADLMSGAASAGQNAGAQQLLNAQQQADLMSQTASAGQNAGAQQLANAQAQADLMSQAALAGQGAGNADFAAARGLTGPQGYEGFMSPYQQEVIDATMADYESELARQQSQLGLGAGSAFGGGRFGVAQGTLGAQGARGMASQLANLRQQGFTQANQLANQAYGQRMGLGQAAQQQAAQNVGLLGQGVQGQQSQAGQMQNQVAQNIGLYGQSLQGQQSQAGQMQNQAAQNIGLYGQGLQGQQSQAGQMQNQVAQNMGLYGQAGQAALGGAQAAQQQAAQNIGLYGQTGQMQSGLASLQPQLAAQQIGLLGQLGAQQQQQQQAIKDTMAQANKMIAFEPYDRMGFFGQQVAGIGGGYPGQTTFSTQQAQSGINPMMQLFGIGASALGGIGNLASTFGYGNPTV